MLLEHLSCVRNGANKTITTQKVVLKKLMKFKRFIVHLLLKCQKTVWTSTNFINFLSAIFWSQNALLPPFLTLLLYILYINGLL